MHHAARPQTSVAVRRRRTPLHPQCALPYRACPVLPQSSNKAEASCPYGHNTWDLLRRKRCMRRTYRRRRQHAHRLLHGCFHVWKASHPASSPCHSQRLAQQRADLQAALHIRAMHDLQQSIRAAYHEDTAAFTRQMWTEARDQGPSSFARLVRSVLKAGAATSHPGRPLYLPRRRLSFRIRTRLLWSLPVNSPPPNWRARLLSPTCTRSGRSLDPPRISTLLSNCLP